MPWYKITANTGPGHQSKRLEYVYRSEKLDKAGKDDLFEEFCRYKWFTDNAMGDVRLVTKLPEEVRLAKLREYQAERDAIDNMIARLREMS
jgi:hypothetical protein